MSKNSEMAHANAPDKTSATFNAIISIRAKDSVKHPVGQFVRRVA